MMTDQELVQKLQTLRNIKPSQEWLSKSERKLKAQMPSSQWPIYSVIFVLALGLSLSLILNESPEKSIKLIQEQQEREEEQSLTPEQTKTEITKTIKKARAAAKKIQTHLEEKIVATKIESAQGDDIDARIKLLEDLDKIKATGTTLEEIEKDINNNDYVLARQKLDKLLNNGILENMNSLKVDSEKEEIIINQDNN